MHLTNDCFVLTPEKAIELVDENTIGRLLVTSCLHLPARFDLTTKHWWSGMMQVKVSASGLIWISHSGQSTRAHKQSTN